MTHSPGRKRPEDLGAGEICLNSMERGRDKRALRDDPERMISEDVSIPVIARGEVETPRHICDVLTQGKADTALIASIVHYGTYTIKQIKDFLGERNVPVRTIW